jgi:hypothetical protein
MEAPLHRINSIFSLLYADWSALEIVTTHFCVFLQIVKNCAKERTNCNRTNLNLLR